MKTQFTKTTFGQLAVGANFYRNDGINGASIDKVSDKRGKPCSLSGDCKPVEFDSTFPVRVLALAKIQ